MTTTIDLKKFCATEEHRYATTEPVIIGGYSYASDARILIRTDATGEADTPKKDTFTPPDYVALLAQCDGKTWAPWPDDSAYVVKDKMECPTCRGRGKVNQKTCDECDGEGIKECSKCGHEEQCHYCDNGYIGGTKCAACDGNGEGSFRHHKMLDGRAVAAKYCARIETLPSAEYCTDSNGHDLPTGKVFFRFDGGIGVVMPLLLVV